MKKYIVLIISLLFVSFSFSAETDAVFKKIKKEYILHNDGSIEYKYSKELKLLSHYSFNRMYGETFIVYNPDFQELKINQAYTIMKNGHRVVTPDNAFNIVLPRAAAAYPAYNQMREMVVTHTALEVGATIFLEYSIISKPTYVKEMMETVILAEDVAVEDYEIWVKVPRNVDFHYSLINSQVNAEAFTIEEGITFRWKFSDLPAASHEIASPANYETNPCLMFSAYSNQNEALEKWTSTQAFKQTPTEEMALFVKNTKAENKTEWELIRALQKHVVENVSTKHNPLKWHNYQIENSLKVWNANVGNELEKTNLLYQLYDLAGFKCQIVAFMPYTLYDAQIASFDNFEHFGLMISTKDKGIKILSAVKMNKKSLEKEYAHLYGFLLANGQELATQKPNAVPKIDLIAKLTMDPGNQIFGNITAHLSPEIFNELEIAQDTSSIQQYFSNALQVDSTSHISLLPPKKGTSLASFSFPIKDPAQLEQQENYYFFTIPTYSKGIAQANLKILPTIRTAPLVVPAIDEQYEYIFTLPKSANWVGKEIHISYKEDFGEMTIDVGIKEGKLVLKKHLLIYAGKHQLKLKASRMNVSSKEVETNEVFLNKTQYAVFRKMMIDWYSKSANELVFKR